MLDKISDISQLLCALDFPLFPQQAGLSLLYVEIPFQAQFIFPKTAYLNSIWHLIYSCIHNQQCRFNIQLFGSGGAVYKQH